MILCRRQIFYGVLIFSVIFLGSCLHKTPEVTPNITIKEVTLGVMPLNGIDENRCRLAMRELELFYGIKTELLPGEILPDSTLVPSGKRYQAQKILKWLRKVKPEEVIYILGLMDEGIAIPKNGYTEWGILGLGACPGPCCVVSTKNMSRGIKSEEQFNDRFVKVVLHEMGHNFGLPHCVSHSECLMRDAGGTVTTVDHEKKWICDTCRGKLNLWRSVYNL